MNVVKINHKKLNVSIKNGTDKEDRDTYFMIIKTNVESIDSLFMSFLSHSSMYSEIEMKSSRCSEIVDPNVILRNGIIKYFLSDYSMKNVRENEKLIQMFDVV